MPYTAGKVNFVPARTCANSVTYFVSSLSTFCLLLNLPVYSVLLPGMVVELSASMSIATSMNVPSLNFA